MVIQNKEEANKPTRMYIDGDFDLLNIGHYDLLRQAKSISDVLVVGVHSDEDHIANKGVPAVMSVKERVEFLKHCKFADEVYSDVKYMPDI